MTITLPYNANIPNAPDNPSFDQPIMKSNSQSIFTIWSIDHVTFDGTAGSNGPGSKAGQHLQVTFNGKNTPGSAPLDPISILYSASGVASTVADMRFQNANSIFPVNLIRAYALCTAAGVFNTQQINVASVTRSSDGVYVIQLTPKAVANQFYGIIASAATPTALPLAYTYTYDAMTTGLFTISFKQIIGAAPTDPTFFSFIILQI